MIKKTYVKKNPFLQSNTSMEYNKDDFIDMLRYCDNDLIISRDFINNYNDPHKIIEVSIKNSNEKRCGIKSGEFSHFIIKDDHKISIDELDEAFNIICSYLIQEEACCMNVDLTEKNNSLKPAKKMTLDEIEKSLGYKIEIVNK